MQQPDSGNRSTADVLRPAFADRSVRRAFFFRRMRGHRGDPAALRELWNYRPSGRWVGDRLLKDIPYAVVGGVATRMYMPERTTADIDLLVEPENFERAISQLIQNGYERKKQPLGFMDTRLDLIGQRMISSRPVDILSSTQPWIHDAVASVRWESETLPIVDLPYLVALKLDASRSVDQGDLSRMLGFASEEDLDRVRVVVRRMLPADVDDLEQYILLGRYEAGADQQ
ncbi:MAG: hypothetical protein JO036_01825 [Candidatus Eremiobacteraeota bacterium]|nr:hypothetical protein [Candidatus Eremiobacteraeota bacterium]